MWGFERRLAGLRLEGRGRRDEHRAAADELASEAAAFLVRPLGGATPSQHGETYLSGRGNLWAHGAKGASTPETIT